MATVFLNSNCASLRLLFFLDTKSTRLFHHSTLENQEILPLSFPHFFRLVISACPGSCKSPTTTCQAVALFPSNGVRQRWGENSCCRVLVHVNNSLRSSGLFHQQYCKCMCPLLRQGRQELELRCLQKNTPTTFLALLFSCLSWSPTCIYSCS